MTSLRVSFVNLNHVYAVVLLDFITPEFRSPLFAPIVIMLPVPNFPMARVQGGGGGCKRGFPKDSCIKKCLGSQGIENFNAAKAHFDALSRKARNPESKSVKQKEKNDNISGRKDSGAGFSEIYGRVMIVPFKVLQEEGEDAWDQAEMAKPKTVIHEYDVIRTWQGSGAVIGFTDMATFEMAPNTTIMISTPPKQKSMVKLVLGNIWINIKKMLKDGSMDIEMNQAIAGARGTKFRCIENEYISEVQVYEGIVEVTSKATSEKIILNPGQGVTANKEGMSLFKLSDSNLNTSAKEREAKKTAPPNLSKPSERNSVEPEKTNIPRNRSDEREWQSLGPKSNGAKESQTSPSVRDEEIPKGHTTKYGF